MEYPSERITQKWDRIGQDRADKVHPPFLCALLALLLLLLQALAQELRVVQDLHHTSACIGNASISITSSMDWHDIDLHDMEPYIEHYIEPGVIQDLHQTIAW